MNRRHNLEAGFTLMELMAVIMIIGILVALLFPAFARIVEQGRRKRGDAQATAIRTAILNYYQVYGVWPADKDSGPAAHRVTSKDVLDRFDVDSEKNPRHILFLETDNLTIDENNEILDPWREPYHIHIDTDGEGGHFDTDGDGHYSWRDRNERSVVVTHSRSRTG